MYKDKLAKIIEMRKAVDDSYELYKLKKVALDSAKAELEAEMQAAEIESVKSGDVRATLALRTGIEIVHEPSVIEWLQNEPNIESDVYIGVKKSAFEPLAKVVMQKTGEVIPGTQTKFTEYLSIRKDKESK